MTTVLSILLVLGVIGVTDLASRRWLNGTYVVIVTVLLVWAATAAVQGNWSGLAWLAVGLAMVPFAYRADATRNRRRNEAKP